MELNEPERKLIGFHLACRLEDFEKEIKKRKLVPKDNPVWIELEQLIYTRIIPESWSGPKPSYWK